MPDPIDWSYSLPFYLAALAFGYALGSIPFGLIYTRMAGLGDVRKIGSGNIGATNVLRTGKKGLAAATLISDALKGALAVLVASEWGTHMGAIAGLGAFLGHLYPIWLKFKGGKGVATYIGVLIAISWVAALVFAIVWLACAFLTRYSSLSALAATFLVPISMLVFGDWQLAEIVGLMTILIWLKHRANIRRLIDGTETKIGQKSEEA